MDNYLIDRETLGEFVDELIKKKPLPVDNAEELNKLREDGIKELDNQIGVAVFSQLDSEQRKELHQLFDNDNGSSEPYEDFFNKTGIDFEKIVLDACQKFSEEFLGGQNA